MLDHLRNLVQRQALLVEHNQALAEKTQSLEAAWRLRSSWEQLRYFQRRYQVALAVDAWSRRSW